MDRAVLPHRDNLNAIVIALEKSEVDKVAIANFKEIFETEHTVREKKKRRTANTADSHPPENSRDAGRQGNTPQPTGPGPSTASDDRPTFEWVREHCSVMIDLIEVRLHEPRPGNADGTYYVDATLVAGTASCEHEGRAIDISLRNAFLSVTSDCYDPAQGSLLGERTAAEASPVRFERSAGGVEIVARPPDTCLKGTLLSGDRDEHVCIIEPARPGEEEVTIAVHAGRGSFMVVATDDLEERPGSNVAPVEKNAVLNAFFFKKLKKDAPGRAFLASSTMRRKPRA